MTDCRLFNLRHQPAPVKRIYFHGNLRLHLHNDALFSFMGKAYRTFRAHQASAENNKLLSQFLRMQLRVNSHNHMLAIQPFDGRTQLSGTNGHKQGVRRKCFHVFRSHLRMKFHLYACFFYPVFQHSNQLTDILFEIGSPRRMQIPSKPVCLLH